MVAMRRALSPQRSLDVLAPIHVYEILGRRPSAVFLDADLQPLAGTGPHRLNELVYRRGQAVPGEQLQLSSGRTFVLDANNVYRGVLLIDPRPISVATALTHAQQDRAAEESEVERLVLAGHLVDVRARRTQAHSLPRYDRMYAADHPLVASLP